MVVVMMIINMVVVEALEMVVEMTMTIIIIMNIKKKTMTLPFRHRRANPRGSMGSMTARSLAGDGTNSNTKGV